MEKLLTCQADQEDSQGSRCSNAISRTRNSQTATQEQISQDAKQQLAPITTNPLQKTTLFTSSSNCSITTHNSNDRNSNSNSSSNNGSGSKVSGDTCQQDDGSGGAAGGDGNLTNKRTSDPQASEGQVEVMSASRKQMSLPEMGQGDIQHKGPHLAHVQSEAGDISMQVDFMRFRSKIFDAIEELRIRRTEDVEYEKRIHRLMAEKYEIENKYESLESKRARLESAKREEVATVHQEYQARIKQLQQEKVKLAATQDTLETEMRMLKDEVRATQMGKYNSEKRLREVEHKLLFMTSQKEEHLTQVSQVEEKAVLLNKGVNEVKLHVRRLEQNVGESQKLVRKLAYTNSHQECLLSGRRSDIARLKRELNAARVALSEQPSNLLREKEELRLEVAKVTQHVQLIEQENERMKKSLQEREIQVKESGKLLDEAHGLIERHVMSLEKSGSEAKEQRQKLNHVSQEKQDLDKHCTQLQHKLKLEEEENAAVKKQLQIQEEEWNARFSTVQDEHSKLSSVCKDLEELNSTWSEKNLQLSEEISQLKAELNKPQCDSEVQAVAEVSTSETQTDSREMKETATQSSVVLANSSCQATAQHADVHLQTDAILVPEMISRCTSTMPLAATASVASCTDPPPPAEQIDGSTQTRLPPVSSSVSVSTDISLSCSLAGLPRSSSHTDCLPTPTDIKQVKLQPVSSVSSLQNNGVDEPSKYECQSTVKPVSHVVVTQTSLRTISAASVTPLPSLHDNRDDEEDEIDVIPSSQNLSDAADCPPSRLVTTRSDYQLNQSGSSPRRSLLSLKRSKTRQLMNVDEQKLESAPDVTDSVASSGAKPSTTSSRRFSFQFLNVPPQAPAVVETHRVHPEPPSILFDPSCPRPKRVKKVHFNSDVGEHDVQAATQGEQEPVIEKETSETITKESGAGPRLDTADIDRTVGDLLAKADKFLEMDPTRTKSE